MAEGYFFRNTSWAGAEFSTAWEVCTKARLHGDLKTASVGAAGNEREIASGAHLREVGQHPASARHLGHDGPAPGGEPREDPYQILLEVLLRPQRHLRRPEHRSRGARQAQPQGGGLVAEVDRSVDRVDEGGRLRREAQRTGRRGGRYATAVHQGGETPAGAAAGARDGQAEDPGRGARRVVPGEPQGAQGLGEPEEVAEYVLDEEGAQGRQRQGDDAGLSAFPAPQPQLAVD